MATRMQQRRGTALQWSTANPVLAAGEIGFETDTNKFKIGNGSSNWAALSYFANTAGLEALLNDGAPAALNTLNEIAAAINDDPTFFTTVGTNLTNHQNDTTEIHGIADTALLATQEYVTDAITSVEGGYSSLAGSGIDWNSDLERFDIDNTIATAASLTDHNAATTSVHGITDTAELATKSYADTAEADAKTYADTGISTHNSDTTNVHGIADTADLATKTYADGAVTTHSSDTTSVHGIADTSVLETTSGAQTKADTAVSTHNSDTTNIHGIADTSLLATTADVAAVTKTTIGLGNVDNTSDANKPVSTATVTAIATAKSEAIAEVTAVIDGAPGALNTLNELAAALGDDANFASTVTNSLATKVDSYTPITQKTASYTLSTLDHRDDLIEMGSASALTLTIPLNSSIAYPVGTSLDILQTGAGQVTIAGAAGVTVNATPGLKLRTQWSSATLFKRAENTWVVYGDLTA
jgi:hypothetical protein